MRRKMLNYPVNRFNEKQVRRGLCVRRCVRMNRNVSMRSMVLAVCLILVLTAGMVSAAPVAQKFVFQGTLTNAADSPLTGTYAVTFRLYNVATGGTALASDTHAVTANKGVYTTTVNFPATRFEGQGLWVSTQRESDPEKLLRTILRPVPYALSLKPGAIISGKTLGSSYALNLKKTDLNGGGLAISTPGKWTYGISINSSGDESEGIHVVVMNKTSNGVGITQRGDSGNAIAVNTYGDSDEGLHVGTLGSASTGIHVQTSEPYKRDSHTDGRFPQPGR